MRKKQLKVDDATKRAVIQKNRNMAHKAFGEGRPPGNMYEDEFVDLVRKLFGYSDKTAQCDIARSWETVFKTIIIRRSKNGKVRQLNQ
jgi:hypothetical protein